MSLLDDSEPEENKANVEEVEIEYNAPADSTVLGAVTEAPIDTRLPGAPFGGAHLPSATTSASTAQVSDAQYVDPTALVSASDGELVPPASVSQTVQYDADIEDAQAAGRGGFTTDGADTPIFTPASEAEHAFPLTAPEEPSPVRQERCPYQNPADLVRRCLLAQHAPPALEVQPVPDVIADPGSQTPSYVADDEMSDAAKPQPAARKARAKSPIAEDSAAEDASTQPAPGLTIIDADEDEAPAAPSPAVHVTSGEAPAVVADATEDENDVRMAPASPAPPLPSAEAAPTLHIDEPAYAKDVVEPVTAEPTSPARQSSPPQNMDIDPANEASSVPRVKNVVEPGLWDPSTPIRFGKAFGEHKNVAEPGVWDPSSPLRFGEQVAGGEDEEQREDEEQHAHFADDDMVVDEISQGGSDLEYLDPHEVESVHTVGDASVGTDHTRYELESVRSSVPPAEEQSATDDVAALPLEEPQVSEPAPEEQPPVAEQSPVEEHLSAEEQPPAVEPVALAAAEHVEQPSLEEPAVEEPAIEGPAVEGPAVEEPAVEEPAVEEPAVEEPAVEETALKESAQVEEAALEESTLLEKPAVEDTTLPEELAVEAQPANEQEAHDPTAAADAPKGAQDTPVLGDAESASAEHAAAASDAPLADAPSVRSEEPSAATDAIDDATDAVDDYVASSNVDASAQPDDVAAPPPDAATALADVEDPASVDVDELDFGAEEQVVEGAAQEADEAPAVAEQPEAATVEEGQELEVPSATAVEAELPVEKAPGLAHETDVAPAEDPFAKEEAPEGLAGANEDGGDDAEEENSRKTPMPAGNGITADVQADEENARRSPTPTPAIVGAEAAAENESMALDSRDKTPMPGETLAPVEVPEIAADEGESAAGEADAEVRTRPLLNHMWHAC